MPRTYVLLPACPPPSCLTLFEPHIPSMFNTKHTDTSLRPLIKGATSNRDFQAIARQSGVRTENPPSDSGCRSIVGGAGVACMVWVWVCLCLSLWWLHLLRLGSLSLA